MTGNQLRPKHVLAAALLPFALGICGPAAAEQPIPAMAGSVIADGDRAGPWGSSSYDFALRVSKSIFKTVNHRRQQDGLTPLQADPALGALAGSYAADMLTGDFFGHFSPDGRDLDQRVESANLIDYDQIAELLWDFTDENIAWYIESTVRNAVTDWLQSKQGHREALLDPNLRLVGIATAIREKRIVVAMLMGRK